MIYVYANLCFSLVSHLKHHFHNRNYFKNDCERLLKILKIKALIYDEWKKLSSFKERTKSLPYLDWNITEYHSNFSPLGLKLKRNEVWCLSAVRKNWVYSCRKQMYTVKYRKCSSTACLPFCSCHNIYRKRLRSVSESGLYQVSSLLQSRSINKVSGPPEINSSVLLA